MAQKKREEGKPRVNAIAAACLMAVGAVAFTPAAFAEAVNAAVIFDTNNPTGGDWDLGGPFQSSVWGTSVPNNVLIIQENGPCTAEFCSEPDDEGRRPAGTIFFDFVAPISLQYIDFFDVETPEAGTPIRLFDEFDNELMPNMFSTPDASAEQVGHSNYWTRQFFDVDGVKRIEIHMGGSGAIDNLTGFAGEGPDSVFTLTFDQFQLGQIIDDELSELVTVRAMNIPLPAVAYLFPAGLIAGLGWMRRRSHSA